MSTSGNLSNAVAAAANAVENAFWNPVEEDINTRQKNKTRLFFHALRIIEISIDESTPERQKLNLLSEIMATASSLERNPCADCEKARLSAMISREKK